jgi:hypothetical protein
MAGKMEGYGEVLGRADIANIKERDGALYITVNVLHVVPSSEVQVGPKVSNHYWMNSLPFVKQTS